MNLAEVLCSTINLIYILHNLNLTFPNYDETPYCVIKGEPAHGKVTQLAHNTMVRMETRASKNKSCVVKYVQWSHLEIEQIQDNFFATFIPLSSSVELV